MQRIPKSLLSREGKGKTHTPKNLPGVCGGPLRRASVYRCWPPNDFRPNVGNGPNTVSGSTVSNTELSEFFGAH